LSQVTKILNIKNNRLREFFGTSLQLIGMVFLIRLIVDTGVRMVYPFVPQISKGLKLTVVGFSWLLFARSSAGLMGPLFGILADRYGRQKIMAVSLLSQSIGMAGVAFLSRGWAIVPMILIGLGSTIFIPAQQAYISDQVSYEKRGRALASVDISYAIVGIVALPIVGWLIETFDWRSPFLISSFLSLIAAAMIWSRFPTPEHRSQTIQTLSEMGRACLKLNVVASMSVGLLLFVAVGCFVTVWGIWLNTDFGLDAVALGLVATGIGVAELGGTSISGLLIDRIGKRFGSQLGLLLTSVFFLLLPLAQENLFWAKLILVLLGALFEFTIVSLFPLYSEQVPKARATIFSLVALGTSLGLGIGPPITAALWEKTGLEGVCAFATICLLIAVMLVWRFLKERPSLTEPSVLE